MSTINKIQDNHNETVLVSSRDKESNVSFLSPFRDAAFLEPYLVILSGLDQGKQFRLHRQFNTVGRTGDTDIKINDVKISRNHGVLIIYPDQIVFEDQQSTNGSFVNDARVKQQIVDPMTRIRLGNTIMKVEYKNASEVESELKLHQSANTDALTNISNRHAFMVRAEEEISFCKRNKTHLTIVMSDVDHFKQTNDNFGHPAGDKVLKDLAHLLHSQMREEDMLARYGGEEFIMFFRNADDDSIALWAERIREKVQNFSFVYDNKIIPTTLSMGICSMKGGDRVTLDLLIKNADKALYEAKNNGRNCVEVSK